MKYNNIPGIDTPVSRLVFGGMIPNSDVASAFDAARSCGINTFDTAHIYQGNERALGTWLKGQRRDEIIIETKGCHPTLFGNRVNRANIIKDVETSLRRLNVDYLDLFLLHHDDEQASVAEIVETLNDLRTQGKVHGFGGSNWTVKRLTEANQYAVNHHLIPFAVSSPNFSLAHQMADPWQGRQPTVSLSGEGEAKNRQWYQKENLAVFAFSALAMGFMSGKITTQQEQRASKTLSKQAVRGYCYPDNFERLSRVEQLAAEKNCTVAQLAIAWLLHQEMNLFVIFASKVPSRIESNAKAIEIVLTDSEVAWLDLQD